MAQCKGSNQRGEPCAMAALTGSDLCWNHDPARGRERAEARKRGGRNRCTPKPSTTAAGGEVRLRSVADVHALLELAATGAVAQENSAQRSRTLGYLAGLPLKALEVGELEERLAALEAALPAREGKTGP